MDVRRPLETLLSCSLCRRIYDPCDATRLPKTLNCGHSYCACCLEQLPGYPQVSCHQCGRKTLLLGLGSLPTNEGLLFMLQQLPALQLGMAMLQLPSEQQLQPTCSNLTNSAWPNWLNEVGFDRELRGANEYCHAHAMPNTTWCQTCRRLLCRGCVVGTEHRNHELTRHNLRRLLCQELSNLEERITYAEVLAVGDMSLFRQLFDACDTVQQHVQRPILQHAPTWLRGTDQTQLHGIVMGNFTRCELLRLLNELQEKCKKFQKQMLYVYLDEEDEEEEEDAAVLQPQLFPSVQPIYHSMSPLLEDISGFSSSWSSSSNKYRNPAAQVLEDNGYNQLNLDHQLPTVKQRKDVAQPANSIFCMTQRTQSLQLTAISHAQSVNFDFDTPSTSAAAASRRPISLDFPIYYLDLEMEGRPAGRVLIEVRNDVAPRMAENFRALILHERGFGYRGCSVFHARDEESIITGAFELHSGGYAALDGRFFIPDNTGLPTKRGAVGMRRRHHNGFVGSQFRMVLNARLPFADIFGFIVDGIDVLDKIAGMGNATGWSAMCTYIKKCGEYRRRRF